MGLYDILFIINLAVMIGIAAYHCYKKKSKTVIYNVIVIILFVLVKLAQVYYVNIRAQLFEILGENLFLCVRDLISVFLFFGSSVTVGIQLISELLSIIVFFLLAARVACIILTKNSKKIFDTSINPENEQSLDKFDDADDKRLFLVLGKLLN